MKNFTFYILILCAVLFANHKHVKAQELWGLSPGVIFKTDANGENQTVVYNFTYGNGNGVGPTEGLTEANGKLYGMTTMGGTNDKGVVFEFEPNTLTYTKKVDFLGIINGQNPSGSLVKAANGKLYGMTNQGGIYSNPSGWSNGYGVLFEFDPATGIFTKKIDFNGTEKGMIPNGSLVAASNGKLYGMTYIGGVYNQGVLFEYDPEEDVFTKRHDFNGTSGSYPYGSLIQAKNGKLYGLTAHGGTAGVGNLFEFDVNTNIYTNLANFNVVNGSYPKGALTEVDGNFYGLTTHGGNSNEGVLFRFNPTNNSITKIYDFSWSPIGTSPHGTLTVSSNGKLYGITLWGGIYGRGTLFEFNPNDNQMTKKFDFNGSNGGATYYFKLLLVGDIPSPVAVCQNTTLYLDENGEATLDVSAIDGGSTGNNISLSASKTEFTCDDIGINLVTLTVTDGADNISTCSADVDVIDNVPPIAVAQNFTVYLDESGNATASAENVDNGSSDNCGIELLTLSQTSFDCSHVGDNSVVLTVTDVSGNENTANSVVTVVDNLSPTVVAQNITVYLDESGNVNVSAENVDNGSSDNCGIELLTLSQTSFDCSHVGDNSVVLTVTDVNGNENTANAVVTVVDNLPPTVVAQNITVYLDESGNVNVSAENVDNGSSDNCGIELLTLSQTSFDCSHVGDNSVVLTVTDVDGIESTVDVVVTVVDNLAPTVVAQNVTVYLDESGNATITAEDIDDGSYDACGIETLSIDISNFSASDTGEPVLVTLTITDVNNNSTTATALVTVISNNNLLPEIISISGPATPVSLGSSFNLTALFNNVQLTSAFWHFSSDGVNYNLIYPASVEGSLISGNFSLSTNVYSVKLVVTDNFENTAESIFQYVVIFDPDGGFVTGVGRIQSPEGALAANPSAVGIANFGFTAKYKNGKNNVNILDGNTNFKFVNGDLNFNSSSHEAMSLVISGTKATYRGVGTVNGTGNHKFIVSVIDGDVNGDKKADKFRIKIFADGSSSEVLYDNQSGTPENADATTGLESGSIVISKPKNKSAEIQTFIKPLPETFDVKVYPNPFTEKLRFEFVSPEPVHARIDLYDLTGRMVKTIFEAPVEGGVYNQAEFVPENAISGMYIYRITLGDEIYNGKAIFKRD